MMVFSSIGNKTQEHSLVIRGSLACRPVLIPSVTKGAQSGARSGGGASLKSCSNLASHTSKPYCLTGTDEVTSVPDAGHKMLGYWVLESWKRQKGKSG